MTKVVSLEMNEINFEFVKSYIALGKLPHIGKLLDTFQLFETESERDFRLLEPWIQWPSVYTGKTYAEHGVFRLGDIVNTDHEQIWEALEKKGFSVGAVSPINAANRCSNADFFVPDPWTVTPVTGESGLERLSGLVNLAVNGNATGGASLASLGPKLFPFLMKYGRLSSWNIYFKSVAMARKYKWAKAAFLDRFLADLFLTLRSRDDTQFSSLFLNAGAHIQHHHLFESKIYAGANRNPDWYSMAGSSGVDPMLFIYELYDGIVRDVMALSDTRILITTGLSQTPNSKTKYQYRFNDHGATLSRLGVDGFEVNPRMSRDFLLTFANDEAVAAAKTAMEAIQCAGAPFFTIEDRGRSLFCQIGYFGPREGLHEISNGTAEFDIANEISLVSIENGIHQMIGYHIDTDIVRTSRADAALPRIPVTSVFAKILSSMDDAESILSAAE